MNVKMLFWVPFVFFAFIKPAVSGDWSEWQDEKTIKRENRAILTIQYRTYFSKKYLPRGQWRVTNHSGDTFYCVGIGDKYYSTNDGPKKKGQVGCITLEGYATETFSSETVGLLDGAKIIDVKLTEIKFRTSKTADTTIITL